MSSSSKKRTKKQKKTKTKVKVRNIRPSAVKRSKITWNISDDIFNEQPKVSIDRALKILQPELYSANFKLLTRDNKYNILAKGIDKFDVSKKPKLKKSSLKKLWNKKDEMFRNAMYNILSIHLNESSADCIDVILSYHGPFIISKIRYSVDLLLFFDESVKKPLKYVWKEAKCENKYKFVDLDILKVSDYSSDEYFGKYLNLLSLWNLDEYAKEFNKTVNKTDWRDANKWSANLKKMAEEERRRDSWEPKPLSKLLRNLLGFRKGHAKTFIRRVKEYEAWKEGILPWREGDHLIFDEFEMEEMQLEHLDSVYAKFAEHARLHFQLGVEGRNNVAWTEESALFAVSQVHKGKTETFVFEIPGDRSRERLNTKRWFYKLYLQQMCKLGSIKGELMFKMDLIAITRIHRSDGGYTGSGYSGHNDHWSDCWDS